MRVACCSPTSNARPTCAGGGPSACESLAAGSTTPLRRRGSLGRCAGRDGGVCPPHRRRPSPALAALGSDGVSFRAVALDAQGRPVPIMNSDEGFALLFLDAAPIEVQRAAGTLTRPFPAGLLTDVGCSSRTPRTRRTSWSRRSTATVTTEPSSGPGNRRCSPPASTASSAAGISPFGTRDIAAGALTLAGCDCRGRCAARVGALVVVADRRPLSRGAIRPAPGR